MKRSGALIIVSLLTALLAGTALASPLWSAKTDDAQPHVTLFPADAQGRAMDSPGYFVATARPGSNLRFYANVGNSGKMRSPVVLTPADAVTSAYGGLAFTLAGRPLKQVGSWIHVARSALTLAPTSSALIHFSVHIPAKVQPGQYVGGLTAFVPNATAAAGTAGLRVQVRVVVAVVITVPGASHSRFTAAHIAPPARAGAPELVLKNSGNTLLRGTGHLWIWRVGKSGKPLSIPIAIGTSIPHTWVNYPVPLGSRAAPGRYTFSLRLSWPGGHLRQRGGFTLGRRA